MNANDFSDAINEIDGTFIKEAIVYRKRGRWIPWAAAVACLVLISNLLLPGSAPAVQNPTVGSEEYWAEGVPLSLPHMGESDLIVESVHIDMDIPIMNHYGTNGIGTAVIEITMHNPSDDPLTIPMTLPCSQPPRYVYTYDQDYNSLCTYPDPSLYRFALNGAAVSATHLVTATDNTPDEERMQATRLIRLDSPVTQYTYRITKLEESDNPRITLWGFSRHSDYIVLVKSGPFYGPLHSDQEISIPIPEGDIPEEGEAITVYVIGEHPEFKPGWYFKDRDTKERLDSTTILESTEVMTFLDFTNQTWNETLGITKENWAFSVAAELNHFPVIDSQYRELHTISIWSYHWLTYELTMAPGETATHRIELPLYPDYSKSNTYHIDLRSLQAMNPTISQVLTVKTPFDMQKTSVEWNHTVECYDANLAGITDFDIEFTLSRPPLQEAPQPNEPAAPNPWITWLCIAALIGLFFLHRKYRREDRC